MTITGTTRLAAVIGWPVAHSRSPQLINAAFAATHTDAVMVPLGVPPAQLAEVIATLRAINALGASVTVPHKLAVAALCDELSPAARDIGAVNCLQFDGERLIGHNTDAPGFADALAAAGFATPAAHVVLLGAGGAARAIAYGLRASATVEVIARRPEAVVWTQAIAWTPAALAAAFARAALVVDCTPAGLVEADERTLIAGLPLEALAPGAWVATLIYHRPTILLERARELGYSTVDGRGMLVHQGARAFAIWTGTPPPLDAMSDALARALRGT